LAAIAAVSNKGALSRSMLLSMMRCQSIFSEKASSTASAGKTPDSIASSPSWSSQVSSGNVCRVSHTSWA
jgi:hypothetical protein